MRKSKHWLEIDQDSVEVEIRDKVAVNVVQDRELVQYLTTDCHLRTGEAVACIKAIHMAQ